ncbi:MAG: hypothetical protein Ct9H90mP2_14980 [Dehalococcoidia bacterium]|nr:MAG: hypothetical protein Ct9H90mP2_14980 [Dehalococcoidia bacterium]
MFLKIQKMETFQPNAGKLMASAGGIGALTGTLVTSRLKEKINLGKLVLASNVVSFFFLFFFGLSNMFIFENNISQKPPGFLIT